MQVRDELYEELSLANLGKKSIFVFSFRIAVFFCWDYAINHKFFLTNLFSYGDFVLMGYFLYYLTFNSSMTQQCYYGAFLSCGFYR